jgi:hypothetical protein
MRQGNYLRNCGPRYSISAKQLAQPEAAERSLPTPAARYGFRLHVSSKLNIAAPIGGVPNELLHNAIDSVLREFAEGVWT